MPRENCQPIIQDAMALVMHVTAILLAVGGILTVSLKDKKLLKNKSFLP